MAYTIEYTGTLRNIYENRNCLHDMDVYSRIFGMVLQLVGGGVVLVHNRKVGFLASIVEKYCRGCNIQMESLNRYTELERGGRVRFIFLVYIATTAHP